MAFLYESGVDGMQEALDGLTKSILRGQTVLAKNVTLRTLWTETEKRLKNTIGLTLKELSKEQRALEILTTIEKNYGATLGLHKMEMDTARGALNRLNTAFTVMKEALGTALIPLLDAFTNAMAKASGYLKGLIDALGPTVPIVMALAMAISFLVAKISFGIGVMLSFMQITKGLAMQAGITAISLWKIVLPVAAIGAAIGVGIYLWMKYSGALDRAKNSASKFSEQLAALAKKVDAATGSDDDTTSAEEDRRIQHQRTTEDIIEDIEREKSKGLWANQIAIKDLEKRLKRENEDWNRYLSKIGASTNGADPTGGLFDDIENALSGIDDQLDFTTNKFSVFRDVLKEMTKDWNALGLIIGTFLGLGVAVIIGKWIATFFSFLTGLAAVKTTLATIGTLLMGSYALNIAVVGAAAILLTLKYIKEFRKEIDSFLELNEEYQENFQETITELRESWRRGDITVEQYRKSLNVIADAQRSHNEAMEGQLGPLEKLKANWLDWGWNVESTINDVTDEAEKSSSAIQRKFAPLKGMFYGIGEAFRNAFTGTSRYGNAPDDWPNYQSGLPHKQTGGIISGMRNQPQLIMAHGGERIIPAGEVKGGENITININNPSIRSDRDITEIVRQVSQSMGQRARYARMGSY